MTGSDLYSLFCFDALEDTGLALGILTDAQFLALLNQTILDFCNRTGIVKQIYTQTTYASTGTYTVPDDILRVDQAFVGGVVLSRETLVTLARERDWRVKTGLPVGYYEDGLAVKTIGVAPTPAVNGVVIPGASEPAPPHAQYGDFITLDALNQPVLPSVHRGLSVVGPLKPTVMTSVTQEIPLIPDDWVQAYLLYGVAERIFSGDNELKNDQAALFCHANYEEGIMLARLAAGEETPE